MYCTEYYPTILLLGDNVFEDSLSGIIEEYGKTERTTIGVYDVRNLELAKRYGIVEVDSDGRVSRFEEKPLNPRATLASVGMYIFSPDDLGRLSGYLGSDNPMDAPGNFVSWLVKESVVYAYILRGRWWDIDSIDSLREAENYFRKNI